MPASRIRSTSVRRITEHHPKEESMDKQEPKQPSLHARINLETAQMPWSELLRYFAGGHVIHVDDALDLVDVAARFSMDDVQAVQDWIAAGRLSKVSDEQARLWLDAEAALWTVVARPWVLVQEKKLA